MSLTHSAVRPDEQAPSHSQILRSKIRLAMPALTAVADEFWSHPHLAGMYPEFLFLVHSMIRASVPMMEMAEEEARKLAGDDPMAAPLADYYARHAREEAGHDDWLLDDMEVLGLDRRDVLRRIPPPTVAGLVGAYYYWIRHVHPVAFLAYLAVLEGNPPKVDELKEIQQRTGLPEEAFRTLVKHAHLDPHHRDDLLELLDRLPLAPEHHNLLALSAFHTIEQVSRALRQVIEAREG